MPFSIVSSTQSSPNASLTAPVLGAAEIGIFYPVQKS
jgi:hypothetical protein